MNAYDDEDALKVTLLEGSVAVKRETSNVKLVPGQQAIAGNDPSTPLRVTKDVDVDQVMAWKNGMFKFNNTNMKQIMREVARWYDVDVEYQGDFSDLNFGGFVSRQANVSELLKRFSATEQVHFKVEGRKIIVMR